MNENEDAKYGAIAALVSVIVILGMVAILGVLLGLWS